MYKILSTTIFFFIFSSVFTNLINQSKIFNYNLVTYALKYLDLKLILLILNIIIPKSIYIIYKYHMKNIYLLVLYLHNIYA